MDGEFPEEMNCPVCLEIPAKEIFQCEKGHIVCDVCAEKITLCPQCRVNLGSRKIRARALEDILDMMKLDCPYKSKGCKEKLSRRTITNHKDNCDFGGDRAPFCKYVEFKCDYIVNSRKIDESIRHLTQNHPCILESASAVSIRLANFNRDAGQEKSLWQPVILQAFDQHLAFIIQSDDKNVSFACILLGTAGTPKLRVEFCILSNLEKEPALKWTTEPISFTQAETILQFQPIHLSFGLLNKCYLENGDLFVNISGFPENSATSLAGNKLVIKIHRVMKLSVENSLCPDDARGTDQLLNPTKFEDLCCDHCQKTFKYSSVYQCLECDDYKQCYSCMYTKKEHSFHHFAVIKSTKQYTRHQGKTMIETARLPYVKCLQKDYDIGSSRESARVITTQRNLKCSKAGCSRKPDLICLFCRGPHCVCTLHTLMLAASKHDPSHYFFLTKTEEATQFALNLLERDNLL